MATHENLWIIFHTFLFPVGHFCFPPVSQGTAGLGFCPSPIQVSAQGWRARARGFWEQAGRGHLGLSWALLSRRRDTQPSAPRSAQVSALCGAGRAGALRHAVHSTGARNLVSGFRRKRPSFQVLCRCHHRPGAALPFPVASLRSQVYMLFPPAHQGRHQGPWPLFMKSAQRCFPRFPEQAELLWTCDFYTWRT